MPNGVLKGLLFALGAPFVASLALNELSGVFATVLPIEPKECEAVLANEIPMGPLPDPTLPPNYIFDFLPERKNGLFHASSYKMPQLFRDLNIPADSMAILSDSRYLDAVDAPTELKQSSQEETSKNKHASICRVDVFCKDATSEPVMTLKGRVESVFNIENRSVIALEEYSEAQGGDTSPARNLGRTACPPGTTAVVAAGDCKPIRHRL